MNILYLIAMYGSEQLAGVIHPEIGHEFQKHGHTFSVFALASVKEMRGRATDQVEENIPVHRAVAAGRAPLDWLNRLTQPLFQYSRFITGLVSYTRYLARHQEIDLVLAEGAYPFGAMAALASLLIRKPFVVSVAGGDFISSRETDYGYGRFALPRALMRLTFRRAAAIRATTPLVREHILQLGGASAKIAIVPRNVASSAYLSPETDVTEFRRATRQKIRAGSGALLLCVGRLHPIKGFDDAIRALPDIRAEFPDAHLFFVGPDRITRRGSYQKELEALAARLQVCESVTFVGAVAYEQIKTWLAAADLLLVPSIIEGMNRTAIEAAAVATPSIITRTAGIAEAAAAAGVSVMLEPRAPADLARKACSLLRDDARRYAMGNAGILFAERFRVERVAAEFIELCEWAVNDEAHATPVPFRDGAANPQSAPAFK